MFVGQKQGQQADVGLQRMNGQAGMKWGKWSGIEMLHISEEYLCHLCCVAPLDRVVAAREADRLEVGAALPDHDHSVQVHLVNVWQAERGELATGSHGREEGVAVKVCRVDRQVFELGEARQSGQVAKAFV